MFGLILETGALCRLDTRPLHLGVPLGEDVEQEDDHGGAVEDEVDLVDPLGPADELPSSGSVAGVHVDALLQLLQLLVDQQQHLRLCRLGNGLRLHTHHRRNIRIVSQAQLEPPWEHCRNVVEKKVLKNHSYY